MKNNVFKALSVVLFILANGCAADVGSADSLEGQTSEGGATPVNTASPDNCEDVPNQQGNMLPACCALGERVVKKYPCGAGAFYGCEPVNASSGMSCTFHNTDPDGEPYACESDCNTCYQARNTGMDGWCSNMARQ